MLNYIWLALILIGITVAVWSDVNDLAVNKYHNEEEFSATLFFIGQERQRPVPNQHYAVSVQVEGDGFRQTYADTVISRFSQNAEYIQGEGQSGVLNITPDERTPISWKQIIAAQKRDKLTAYVQWDTTNQVVIRSEGNNLVLPVRLKFDPVKFVKLNAVTNDGIIKYAKTAVELAIGLIGIMALWLGVMKIAEQSGLVAKLAALLKPVTSRLFPDVPPDHPAMGAMVMNISANMLGLANAATPLGLKAMEELNKLSKKVGTATDAMCTFLVINTSSVQLIPATVIAIRAASGSTNPTEILGPVIVATTVNTLVGIITVRLLSKLPIFKRQLETGGKND